MSTGTYAANFSAGAFLCNCIPHLVAGLQGQAFPTPFARPRGVGLSPPWINFLWGMFNLVVGIALVENYPVELGINTGSLVSLCGALCLGGYLSVHFGRVRK